MNALDKMQKFCNEYHDLIVKVGAIFAFGFLCIFVPGHAHKNALNEAHEQALVLLAKDESYLQLQRELDELKFENAFYKASHGERKILFQELQCLAKNIYFEASSEPTAGKIAVAQVTMNRVRSPYYPNTVCEVVYQRTARICQFSWVCEGTKFIRDGQNWRDSLKIAEDILISNKKYNIIPASTKNFHADYVSPRWAEEKIFVAKIGRHLFYR